MLQVVSAFQADRDSGEWLQEDIENMSASIVAPKEYKVGQKGMQTCDENPLTAFITSQKYENERELIKEDKDAPQEYLCLESPKSERERDNTWKNVTSDSVSLDDVREKDDVATAALQNPEAQVRKTCTN
jgi:hypothetical protein